MVGGDVYSTPINSIIKSLTTSQSEVKENIVQEDQENLVLVEDPELNPEIILSPSISSAQDSSLTICSTIGHGASPEELEREQEEKNQHQLHKYWSLNNAILNHKDLA